MATALHDVEALAALAEGAPGPARTWALCRLAIAAPERFAAFPADEEPPDVVFAAGPPGLVDRMIEALQATDPCPAGLATSTAALGAFGLLPADPAPLAAAIRGALGEPATEADLWLALALAGLGEADGEVLRAVNEVASPDRTWILPTLVLRVADTQDALGEAAHEVGQAMLDHPDPDLLFAVIAALGGAPTGHVINQGDDVARAIHAGARAAGAEPPSIKVRKGSRHRRIQGAVLDLLEGVQGPVAALLRAVHARDTEPKWGLGPVAIAAWLASFEPDEPVDDVLHRLGGADPHRLSAARRAVTPDHRDEVLTVLRQRSDPAAGVLAMPLVRGDEELAGTVVDRLAGRVGADVRVDALACVAAWHCADRVPELLEHRPSRDLGLLMAEFAPTEQVLEALLGLPVPADRDPRIQYAQALAAMGDPAVLPTLGALLEQDPQGDLAGARVLAESILHRPVPVG